MRAATAPPANIIALRRRLFPLYAAIFSMSLVLWYPIEKLYQRSIGFDDALIGVFFAVFSATMLLVEVPTGILADRWSRRGALMLAILALIAATTLGALSDAPPLYFVSGVLWAIFFALYSGTSDSIIYDTMLEEGVPTEQFDRYLGKTRVAISIASVVGSLTGGVVASIFGLEWAYILTIPLVVPAFLALWKLREPTLHKQSVTPSFRAQFAQTLRAIRTNREVVGIVASLAMMSVIIYVVTEFNQLWSIALLAPVVLYGPINAFHLATGGIGGYIASKFRVSRPAIMSTLLVVAIGSSFTLVYSRNLVLTVTAIALLCICFYAIQIVFSRRLHSAIPSSVRAGASSATSTIARLVMIPAGIAIGAVSTSSSIFTASWLVVGCTVVTSIVLLVSFYHGRRLHP